MFKIQFFSTPTTVQCYKNYKNFSVIYYTQNVNTSKDEPVVICHKQRGGV